MSAETAATEVGQLGRAGRDPDLDLARPQMPAAGPEHPPPVAPDLGRLPLDTLGPRRLRRAEVDLDPDTPDPELRRLPPGEVGRDIRDPGAHRLAADQLTPRRADDPSRADKVTVVPGEGLRSRLFTSPGRTPDRGADHEVDRDGAPHAVPRHSPG